MNFYDSLSFNWSFSRFYGLNYFTNDHNKLKITKKSFTKAIIPGISFILLSFVGMFTVRAEQSDYQSFGITSLLFVVGQLGVFVQFTNGLIIMIVACLNRKGLLTFYETVFELDDILVNQLKIELDYRKMKSISSTRLSQLVFLIIICIIDYVHASNSSYIIMLAIYSFSIGTNVMNSLEYINAAKIIKFRFKLLNKLIATTHDINPHDLETMMKCHFTLNDLITSMNEVFGSRQLSSITNDFVIIVVQLYSFFVAIDNNFNDVLYVKFLFGSLMLPSLMSKLYFTSTNCQKALSYKNKFGKLLKKFECLKVTTEVSYLVYIFFLQFNIFSNLIKLIFRLITFDCMNSKQIIDLQHFIFSPSM